MSEEILKVLLADLRIIRIVCQKCETVIEMNVEKLDDRMKGNACPVCGFPFGTGQTDTYNVFHELWRVFRRLETVKGSVAIEFPVKLNQPESPPPAK